MADILSRNSNYEEQREWNPQKSVRWKRSCLLLIATGSIPALDGVLHHLVFSFVFFSSFSFSDTYVSRLWSLGLFRSRAEIHHCSGLSGWLLASSFHSSSCFMYTSLCAWVPVLYVWPSFHKTNVSMGTIKLKLEHLSSCTSSQVFSLILSVCKSLLERLFFGARFSQVEVKDLSRSFSVLTKGSLLPVFVSAQVEHVQISAWKCTDTFLHPFFTSFNKRSEPFPRTFGAQIC